MWTDILFFLEVARRRVVRLLARGAALRWASGLPNDPDAGPDQPGLLLLQIEGLSKRQLEQAFAADNMPFLQSLLEEQQYGLHPLYSDISSTTSALQAGFPEVTLSARGARTAVRAVLMALLHLPSALRSTLVRNVTVSLNRGLPIIYATFSDYAECVRRAGTGSQRAHGCLVGIDRSIRRLFRAAALSEGRDYQVWVFSDDGDDGFALMPAGTKLPDEARQFIRPRSLIEGALIALGRKQGGREAVARPEMRSPGKLRVMTYNVHSCVGLDGRLSCGRIIRAIRTFDPDVVALQEVDIKRKRSRGENQVERIAGELGMHFAFCSTVKTDLEHYGHALLSRFPIEQQRNGTLPAAGSGKIEPRGALVARIDLPGHCAWVINTHLGLWRAERLAHLRELLGPGWLGQAPAGEPVILCGDFNMIPGSAAYKFAASKLRDIQLFCGLRRPLPTFVSTYPITRIDYIFVNEQVEVEAIRAPRNSITAVASDHLPLIADLAIKKPG